MPKCAGLGACGDHCPGRMATEANTAAPAAVARAVWLVGPASDGRAGSAGPDAGPPAGQGAVQWQQVLAARMSIEWQRNARKWSNRKEEEQGSSRQPACRLAVPLPPGMNRPRPPHCKLLHALRVLWVPESLGHSAPRTNSPTDSAPPLLPGHPMRPPFQPASNCTPQYPQSHFSAAAIAVCSHVVAIFSHRTKKVGSRVRNGAVLRPISRLEWLCTLSVSRHSLTL